MTWKKNYLWWEGSDLFTLWQPFLFLQTAILLLRIDDIVSGSKKNKEESGGEAQPME